MYSWSPFSFHPSFLHPFMPCSYGVPQISSEHSYWQPHEFLLGRLRSCEGLTGKQGTFPKGHLGWSCGVTGLWHCWGGMGNEEADRVEEVVLKRLHEVPFPSFHAARNKVSTLQFICSHAPSRAPVICQNSVVLTRHFILLNF